MEWHYSWLAEKEALNQCWRLVFTFICIIYLYIPLMYIGFSPFWAAILVVVAVTIVSVYLICGGNQKEVVRIAWNHSGSPNCRNFCNCFWQNNA
ncbi:MAG: YibE/F family protein [Eubacterium ventriosum]